MKKLNGLNIRYDEFINMKSQKTKKSKTSKQKSPSNTIHQTVEKFTDPFLLDAGTNIGNIYRMKRAIIRLEQEDLENQARIRDLKTENEKLKAKLKRIQEQSGYTDKMEKRFEQISSIIMEGHLLDDSSDVEEEEEDKND